MPARRFTRMSVLAMSFIAGSAALPAVPAAAQTGQRYVTVNGVLLDEVQLQVADRQAGYELPNGHYWYDQQSGYWGQVGGAALGRVPPQPLQPGWSWRNDTTGEGMIYNPDGADWQDKVWVSPN